MRVFKYALAMAARKPLFFLIYAVGLSFMGVVMALAVTSAEPSDSAAAIARPEVTWAVVDRDGSDLSHALIESLEDLGPQVDVADNKLAMEEAVAQGQADCLFIVPAGFGKQFLDAARTGAATPVIEAAYGFVGAEGALASAAADRWLAAAAVAAAASPEADATTVAKRAAEDAGQTAQVGMLPSDGAETSVQNVNAFTFYLQWSIYTTVASIIACTAALFSTFNGCDVRRRDLASPCPFLSYTLQVAAAALVVTLVCWGTATVIGLAFFGADAIALGPAGLAATLVASLVFSLVPLAVSFLTGQFGCSLGGANAIGNLLGMGLSFLGGAWISLSLLGPDVQAVARFTPGWWYTQALEQAQAMAGAADLAVPVAAVAGDLAVVALFALALFLVALVAGKLREQTAEAGGNGAVEGA
ncbi:ABC transporter permease [Atopobiaceae bacterium 24-176]